MKIYSKLVRARITRLVLPAPVRLSSFHRPLAPSVSPALGAIFIQR